MLEKELRDPFIEKFFARIAPAVAASFTPPQLAAIKMAFGGRAWGNHPIDIRLSLPLLWRRFYVVLIAGPERRPRERRLAERRSNALASLGNAIVTIAFFLVLMLLLVLALYSVETVVEFGTPGGGSSPGFLRDLMDQLGQLFK